MSERETVVELRCGLMSVRREAANRATIRFLVGSLSRWASAIDSYLRVAGPRCEVQLVLPRQVLRGVHHRLARHVPPRGLELRGQGCTAMKKWRIVMLGFGIRDREWVV
jgi:hypothetical protein